MYPQSGSGWSALVPISVAVLLIVLRSSRPRRLRIETLWVFPAIYVVLLATSLAAAPPPVTPISVGLLILGFLVGGALGWQRGRFTEIHIHPETHDISSRQGAIGLVFILAIFGVRYFARGFLTESAGALHVPVVAVLDSLFVLAIAMLAVQRLELWLRASRMLADARAAKAAGTQPPLVS